MTSSIDKGNNRYRSSHAFLVGAYPDRTPYRLATIFFSYINKYVGAKRVISPRELFNVTAEHDLTVIEVF